MPEPNDNKLEAQLLLLKRMYQRGRISEGDYRAELADLGVDPAVIFDQRGVQTEQLVNVARDYIDRRQMIVEPGAGPDALRRAYLHRVAQRTRRLPLAGVDPKTAGDQAAGGEGSGELELSSVYTALLTRRPELEYRLMASAEDAQKLRAAGVGLFDRDGLPERETRYLSALEMLNREAHLVLLGGPGSGKSTFVNFVALCLAGEGLGWGDGDANLSLLTTPLPAQDDEGRRGEQQKPRPQPWDHGPLLPVRIVLRDLAARGLPEPGQGACTEAGVPPGAEGASGDVLWAFIVDELGDMLKEYAPHLKAELLEQGGLILLDGLDEVPDAHQRREQVKQVVQEFAACFPRCRFLATSRTYAYQRQDWKLDGFAEVVLNPFSPAQIVRFVDGWYDHIGAIRAWNPDDARGKATLLKTAIERSERLSELAARPLLLTLMASLHAWRGGSLPEKREELYADAVDLLLDQWESPKVVRDAAGRPLIRQPSLAEWLKVDRDLVRAELNCLAFEAHRDQPELVGAADVPQERLVSRLMNVANNPAVNPARLVEYVRDRAGLLAARAEGVYAFPHRTFQEYLAACHLTNYGFPRSAAELLRADPQRWREAILLAGAKASRGSLSNAWYLAEALCPSEPPVAVGQDGILPPPERQDAILPYEPYKADCWGALLAARVLMENIGARLADVDEWDIPKRERIRRWLLAIVTQGWLPPVDRALAGKALAVLGDDRDFDELVEVPEGTFLMGSSNDDEMAGYDEKPQHELTLLTFKIGKYPVTNAQYLRFIQATNRGWYSPDTERLELVNCPAVYVSWHDARAYCAWLTDVWREETKIAADEIVRLPTEAEWEKAARSDDGRLWPWGDRWDEALCDTGELGLGATCAVGIFPGGASPYGCLDMVGQVWEWTVSLWDENFGLDFEYPYNPNDGRENLDAGENVRRVLRGGSFHSYRERSRCAYRYVGYAPDNNWDSGGFRVMVSSISPLAYQKAAHSARQGSPDPGLAAESARHKTLTATVRSARLTAGPGADQTTSH